MHARRRLLAWIAVAAVVVLPALYYWTPGESPGSGAAMPDNVPVVSMPSASTPAPERGANSPVRLVVNGVVMAPASRSALIAVDDKPATLFAEGAKVGDGLVLLSVGPDRIVVKRGDELLRLPLRGKGSTEGVASGLDGGESNSDNPPMLETPLPPPGTEERRIYQGRD
jgi:hypothetical protein